MLFGERGRVSARESDAHLKRNVLGALTQPRSPAYHERALLAMMPLDPAAALVSSWTRGGVKKFELRRL